MTATANEGPSQPLLRSRPARSRPRVKTCLGRRKNAHLNPAANPGRSKYLDAHIILACHIRTCRKRAHRAGMRPCAPTGMTGNLQFYSWTRPPPHGAAPICTDRKSPRMTGHIRCRCWSVQNYAKYVAGQHYCHTDDVMPSRSAHLVRHGSHASLSASAPCAGCHACWYVGAYVNNFPGAHCVCRGSRVNRADAVMSVDVTEGVGRWLALPVGPLSQPRTLPIFTPLRHSDEPLMSSGRN